ncbi:ABC transporter permease [Thermoflexus sp.]|uniref:ABC transporter permease n=1 Tax=Thermoflexus sp. TaxID=1969742 RepID=UPI0025CCF54A|nr:ABC transporter permease subunit [Thermoflexus sp.]MDW8181437.1 ABC transporter permease subunit [Anaerolineae bacterium]MCS6962843.1 ABC transporter permease [Thermoflexus sp.]MCS7351978.1 ABC transporter permease [Thermoflexus sp.]MCX7690859.1 ABC transporter permease [Thermoflexus sp.]MDW8185252.1 ABC transporter permease subunit [Anaerolineae bacterium]
MKANIYWFELRRKRNSLLIWSASIALVALLYMGLFPTFADYAAVLQETLKRLPPEYLEAFGMAGVDLSSVTGYYSFVFTFLQILLALQASNYGFGLIAVEEGQMISDFLVSKPVTRAQILTSKLLAAFTALTLTNAVAWASSFIFVEMFREGRPYDAHPMVLMLGSIAIFQVVFLSLGLAFSLLVRRVRSVAPYGLMLSFGAYVLNAFGDLLGDVKLELITPFRHFDPTYIVRNNAYDMPLVGLSVAMIGISLAFSYWRYIRHDIPAVV